MLVQRVCRPAAFVCELWVLLRTLLRDQMQHFTCWKLPQTHNEGGTRDTSTDQKIRDAFHTRQEEKHKAAMQNL